MQGEEVTNLYKRDIPALTQVYRDTHARRTCHILHTRPQPEENHDMQRTAARDLDKPAGKVEPGLA